MKAPELVVAVDLRGVVTFCGGPALDLLALDPQRSLGTSLLEQLPESSPWAAHVRRALAGEEVVARDEGGAAFDTRHWPLRDRTGAVVGAMSMAWPAAGSVDLSRVLAHEGNSEPRFHSQKLESLGLLAGGIAHDFNNLLTGILGNASLASLALPPNHRARPHLEEIAAAGRRAANLTRQMLAYSGKGRFEVRPLSLTSQVRDISRLLECALSKLVALRMDLDDALPAVVADVAQLQQLVMNLVINAADAIGEAEGEIVVTTGSADLTGVDVTRLLGAENLRPGPCVFVRVRDTGCGIDDATKGKIFDPFFTTKAMGRGLGLAAVLGIVRAHRGALALESEVGRGTAFTVYFPKSDLPAQTSRKIALGHVRGSGAVLVVDDEPLVRAVARRTLQHLGFSVLEAADGAEGVSVFREHEREIRVVVLDMAMPTMSGEETLRAIREIRADVVVVLSSGYVPFETTHRLADGHTSFLQKPYSPGDLGEKIMDALSRSAGVEG